MSWARERVVYGSPRLPTIAAVVCRFVWKHRSAIGSTALDYTPPPETDFGWCRLCPAGRICPACYPAVYTDSATLDNYHAHAP